MKSAPEGWHTVTPRIVVSDVEQLIDFLRDTFGAAGEYRASMPSEMKIGDSTIMVSGAGVRDTVTAFLYVYVDDAADLELEVGKGARRAAKGIVIARGARYGRVVDRLPHTQLERAQKDAEADVRADGVVFQIFVAGARAGERELPGAAIVLVGRRDARDGREDEDRQAGKDKG